MFIVKSMRQPWQLVITQQMVTIIIMIINVITEPGPGTMTSLLWLGSCSRHKYPDSQSRVSPQHPRPHLCPLSSLITILSPHSCLVQGQLLRVQVPKKPKDSSSIVLSAPGSNLCLVSHPHLDPSQEPLTPPRSQAA